MFSNNNHNRWSAGQLSAIIDSIRAANNGKCSVRMVGERIGKCQPSTWQIIRDAGLPTRLYEESLEILDEPIEKDASNLTFEELHKKYGASWTKEGFYSHLAQKEIRWKQKKSQIIKDYSENGYDFSALTIAEIAEMYDLRKSSVHRILRREGIPYLPAQRGRKSKVKA